ncbi:hypothetical protein SAMD00019534_115230 [Acytostelium subglobosum LB1]|uniref:hypothetical protein n=1 Tax=Acytostelium subglobosum LB1 TaxID=1410327 RepID=UPI000644CA23|nr:hypothetical protein SAMD00019534_115230 [Acytostelium subglobosum LB1]GAM28347.1 hypothetical protein SAMD00019534_115230 [Acytostelium subglobosum LB1]|eukprot:XP_012748664.1 hypothetical protein SAMD00019534_115230 [Acytostelium subglobosum LB1]
MQDQNTFLYIVIVLLILFFYVTKTILKRGGVEPLTLRTLYTLLLAVGVVCIGWSMMMDQELIFKQYLGTKVPTGYIYNDTWRLSCSILCGTLAVGHTACQLITLFVIIWRLRNIQQQPQQSKSSIRRLMFINIAICIVIQFIVYNGTRYLWVYPPLEPEEYDIPSNQILISAFKTILLIPLQIMTLFFLEITYMFQSITSSSTSTTTTPTSKNMTKKQE